MQTIIYKVNTQQGPTVCIYPYADMSELYPYAIQYTNHSLYPVISHNKNIKTIKNKYIYIYMYNWGFPGGSDSKESTCNAKDLGSIPGLERSPGEGNGSPLQYSCLENPMDRGAWRATVHRVTKSWIQLSD